MSQVGHQDAKAAARKYLMVLGALFFCTIVNVFVTRLPLGNHALTIGFAISVSIIQACLVAGYLMHVVAEKWLVITVIGLTAILFLVLLVLTIGSEADQASHLFR